MSQEQQVLDLMTHLLSRPLRKDRTGTGTYSSFSHRLEFDLSDGTVPILTTKKVYYRSVIEELLFFIRGDTDSKKLKSKIWRGNSSKEYLEKMGLPYEEGELGPVYGFQWRNFGADYETISGYKKQLYSLENGEMQDTQRIYLEGMLDKHKGVDQLKDVISRLLKNPEDRRLIVSAWNPVDIPKMVLPPCHVLYQLYVDGENVDMQVYQRSADVFLGLPFNIASYGILLHMIAKEVGLKAGRLIFNLGDAHIYSNHVEQVKKQLKNEPYQFPTIKLADKSLFEMDVKDVEIVGYESHEAIKAEMAV
jgi:thymidylate synthase